MFWGFGAKIKPAFCDVLSVGVAVRPGVGRIGLFMSRWRVIFGIIQWSQSQKAL